MSKFLDPFGADPAIAPAQRLTPLRVRANGAAALQVARVVSPDEQRAWFGAVVFGDAPVRYDEPRNQFLVNDKAYTPEEVYAAGLSGMRLD